MLLVLLGNHSNLKGQQTNTYTSKVISQYDYHTPSRVLLTEKTITANTTITICDSLVIVENKDLNISLNLILTVLDTTSNNNLLYSNLTNGDNIFIGVYDEYITIIFLYENSIIYKVYDFYIDTKNNQKVWN